ncbi:MAG: S8 family peptidase [Syntrophobacteraceae bacterium]|nr:S8 family peptidase [Syntrophobacteraceae bacterium]
MVERPLLALPKPNKVSPTSKQPPREKVPGISAGRQTQRLGPKFDRLSQVLPDPTRLAELRDDPSAIVPERALVFEVTGTLTDFYRSVNSIPGLEFLGEEEDEIIADEDFVVVERGEPKTAKAVPIRFYFTIPDTEALRELVRLWELFKAQQPLGHGKSEWKKVFEHLADVRPWGPKDRLSEETIANWKYRIDTSHDEPVRFEVEFWYRDQQERRLSVERAFSIELERLGGTRIDRAEIIPIRYHAVLVEVPANVIQELVTHPDIGLAKFDNIMILRPQSVVGEPTVDSDVELEAIAGPTTVEEQTPPIAALFDGLPMSGHDFLSGRLEIDDPDDFSSEYGRASEQRHGTAMASLILHGDLNAPPSTVRHPLYVRPVMTPQPSGFGRRDEFMPPDRLGIDLMWRAFRRMMEGEDGNPPSAPTVRIVNLSLGDTTRRFAGVMSPWARLIDHLAWEYGLLILISAGNVCDPLSLPDVMIWRAFEESAAEERQEQMLRNLLAQRANRRLFSPSEAINSLTIGACHDDNVVPNSAALMAVTPYVSCHLPNPSSALGLGFHRAVKPELLFPGGREQVQSRYSHAPIEVTPVGSPVRFFGIKAAAPSESGQTNFVNLHNGTSVATALATHSATQVFESLKNMPSDQVHPAIDDRFSAVILKTLLVHAARWDDQTTDLLRSLVNPSNFLHHEHVKAELTRMFGYGCADMQRVLDCTAKRATLVGWGMIRDKEVDQYRVPMPAELEGIRGFRAATITIAWLTPVNLKHRMYRMAKLEGGAGSDKKFSLGVENAKVQPSHHAVARGTVFHRRWEGEDAVAFADGGDLVFNVSCKAAAGELDDTIPYGVALSLEVGQDVSVAVYEKVKEKIEEQIRSRLRAGVPVTS